MPWRDSSTCRQAGRQVAEMRPTLLSLGARGAALRHTADLLVCSCPVPAGAVLHAWGAPPSAVPRTGLEKVGGAGPPLLALIAAVPRAQQAEAHLSVCAQGRAGGHAGRGGRGSGKAGRRLIEVGKQVLIDCALRNVRQHAPCVGGIRCFARHRCSCHVNPPPMCAALQRPLAGILQGAGRGPRSSRVRSGEHQAAPLAHVSGRPHLGPPCTSPSAPQPGSNRSGDQPRLCPSQPLPAGTSQAHQVGVEARHTASRRLQLHQGRHVGVVICARHRPGGWGGVGGLGVCGGAAEPLRAGSWRRSRAGRAVAEGPCRADPYPKQTIISRLGWAHTCTPASLLPRLPAGTLGLPLGRDVLFNRCSAPSPGK